MGLSLEQRFKRKDEGLLLGFLLEHYEQFKLIARITKSRINEYNFKKNRNIEHEMIRCLSM